MATNMRRRPHSKNPPHHIPTHRLSPGSEKQTQLHVTFMLQPFIIYSFIHSFLACAEYDSSLPFSGASSIPLCYVRFPATLLHQLFFQPLSPHLAIYFLVYLSDLLFPNSYIILFWEFHFLPFSVHVQINVIYLTLFSLL